MKKRCFFGVLCSVYMLFGIVSSAEAAELPDSVPLSGYAGKTITCEVFMATENDITSNVLEVAIPQYATKAEESKLLQEAIFGHKISQLSYSSAVNRLSSARSLPQPGDWNGPFQYISYNTDIPMLYSPQTLVGSGTLFSTYPTMVVMFENLSYGNGATDLTIKMQNTTKNLTWYKDIKMSEGKNYTYFIYSENGSLRFEMNNHVSVYAYTQKGYANADACTVWGSLQDMG